MAARNGLGRWGEEKRPDFAAHNKGSSVISRDVVLCA